MEIKILQVFLGADGLPYKDQERTVHFPIVGSGFQGASNTTKIRFYYDELVEQDDTETAWVACAKLPNGKIGSKVLETDYDSTLGEHYALLELDSFYFQYKGDVYISLQGYQGGVQVDYDEETELYTIYGTPTIAATGSIKLSVNYATQFVGSGETSNVNFQRILADLGTKLGIRATSVYVEELPTVGNPDTFYVIHNDLSDPNKANIYIWNSVTEHYVWVGDNSLYLGDYYTKEKGETLEREVEETNNRIDELGAMYNFKGSKTVAQINALTNMSAGDAYNVTDSGTITIGSVLVSAGDNVAWTGSVWDKLSNSINLSGYVPTSRKIAGIDLFDDITKSELQSALDIDKISETLGTETITETLTLTWTDNYYLAPNGGASASNGLRYSQQIDVNEGDIISTDAGGFRFVTAYDENGTAQASAGVDSGQPLTYTVPSGIKKVAVTKYMSSTTNMFKTYQQENISAKDTVARNSVDELADNIGSEQKTYNKTSALNDLTWTDGYMDQNGTISSTTGLHYTNKIPVKEGDKLFCRYDFRFVTAFNASNQVVSASGSSSSINQYIVPENIAFVVLSLYTGSTDTIYKTTEVTEYVFERKPFGYLLSRASLSDADVIRFPKNDLNKNFGECFSGQITSFTKIQIGRGDYYAEIDNTNVTIYKSGVASTPQAHGLTITNNIQLKLLTNTDGKTNPENYKKMSLTITSNGEQFTVNDASWTIITGNPFVKSVGSTLTNCSFSFNSFDLNKIIYAFGDSYFSWYDARWVYYMALDGFANNVLTNAFAGESSIVAINSLYELLKLGSPKYVFWCLGMNDGSDSSSEPSANWKKCIDLVISFCDTYGITPILATIPTVPTVNNEKKNEWVRNSGYRYVDFAKAVGAQADGTWYSGMMGDGVHPSVKGAKALYNQVIADFPEIMIDN